MTLKFAVITKVPDPEKGESGNLAIPFPLYFVAGHYPDEEILPGAKVIGRAVLAARAPVFSLSEILILNDDGREVSGHLRKPSKWEVEVEAFDDIEKAVEMARRITGEAA